MVEFDLQEFLRDMRQEQRESYKDLSEKIDKTFDTLGDHGTRLVMIEAAWRNMKWFTRTAISALIAFIVDLLVNHLPKLFK